MTDVITSQPMSSNNTNMFSDDPPRDEDVVSTQPQLTENIQNIEPNGEPFGTINHENNQIQTDDVPQEENESEEERKRKRRQTEDCCVCYDSDDSDFFLLQIILNCCRGLGHCTMSCCECCGECIHDCCANTDGGDNNDCSCCIDCCGGDTDCSCDCNLFD